MPRVEHRTDQMRRRFVGQVRGSRPNWTCQRASSRRQASPFHGHSLLRALRLNLFFFDVASGGVLARGTRRGGWRAHAFAIARGSRCGDPDPPTVTAIIVAVTRITNVFIVAKFGAGERTLSLASLTPCAVSSMNTSEGRSYSLNFFSRSRPLLRLALTAWGATGRVRFAR